MGFGGGRDRRTYRQLWASWSWRERALAVLLMVSLVGTAGLLVELLVYLKP